MTSDAQRVTENVTDETERFLESTENRSTAGRKLWAQQRQWIGDFTVTLTPLKTERPGK